MRWRKRAPKRTGAFDDVPDDAPHEGPSGDGAAPADPEADTPDTAADAAAETAAQAAGETVDKAAEAEPEPEPAAEPETITGRVTVEQHLADVLAMVSPLAAFEQPLTEAVGLAIHEDTFAAGQLPTAAVAAIDGFAVQSGDLVRAAEGHPVQLRVIDRIMPGPQGKVKLRTRDCVQIAAGAAIPDGVDAVVPFRLTDAYGPRPTTVRTEHAVERGEGIRPAGDDVDTGDRLVAAGTMIGPREVGLLAALGHTRVVARPRPRVAVISTGTELHEPGTTLRLGEGYDSNSYMLAAAVRAAGATPYRVSAVDDDPEALRTTINEQIGRADLIVTSGGSSSETQSVLREALAGLGSMTFRDIAIAPVLQTGFGVLGEVSVPGASTPTITLPGNPQSAYVGFEVFVRAAIRRLGGWTPEQRRPMHAIALKAFKPSAQRRRYARGLATRTDTGWQVRPVGGGAVRLSALARANALVVLEPAADPVQPGDLVQVLLLDEA